MPSTMVRIDSNTKARLECLAGQDYTMDDVIRILLEDFISDDCDDCDDGIGCEV